MTLTTVTVRECPGWPVQVVPAMDDSGVEQVPDPDLTEAMTRYVFDVLTDPDGDHLCASCEAQVGSTWTVHAERDTDEVIWKYAILVEKTDGTVQAVCEDCGGFLL